MEFTKQEYQKELNIVVNDFPYHGDQNIENKFRTYRIRFPKIQYRDWLTHEILCADQFKNTFITPPKYPMPKYFIGDRLFLVGAFLGSLSFESFIIQKIEIIHSQIYYFSNQYGTKGSYPESDVYSTMQEAIDYANANL